jgi:hypothetical protein
LVSGAPVVFTTTGALPTGITSGTTYYALVTGSDTFNIAATAGGAAITTTGSQSGTHTASSNINLNKPLPVLPSTSTDWWIESGTTNRWSAFDLARNTRSTGASPMTIVFAPGERVNALAILGMEADTLTITATSGGATVYSKTEDLLIRRVNDGYDYFFEPFDFAPSYVAFDLPPYTNMIITITLSKTTGTVACGSIVVGTSVYLGMTEEKAESDALNFSTIDRDVFGNATLVPRRTVPKTRQTLLTPNSRLGKVLDVRTNLNAVPAVWAATDDGTKDIFEPMLILGVYKQFTINLAYSNDALVTLELEEI